MNAVWLAPVLVLAIGLGVVLYVARDSARAARELGEEVRRFGDLRAALNGLTEESEELRRGLARQRRK